MPQVPENESVDIEGILQEIRRRARDDFHACESSPDLQAEIQGLMDNSRLGQDRAISSHRPLAGRAIVWLRKILHGEIRRSVDPALEKQTAWNLRASRILLRQQEEIERLRRELAAARDTAPPAPGDGADEATIDSSVSQS